MGIVVLATAVALLFDAPAIAADPAQTALASRDAYVSPRVLGPATTAGQATVTAAARRLNLDGRAVKLAVVAGPVGAPTLQVYARGLAGRLGYSGTLVVTTPSGTIAAVGPRPAATMTRALRAARVGRIVNPVDRLVAAAEVAAPAAVDPGGQGTRSVLILIALGGLGALWAVALGSGRGERRTRRQVAESRARTRVCLDALGARAGALTRRDDLPPPAREGVARALTTYATATTSLEETRRMDQIDELAPDVRSGMDEIARAAETVGEEMPSDDPFAGLCAIDPIHGPASDDDLCPDCADAAERGEMPPPRMLAQDGRPVRFDAVTYGPVLRPDETKASPS